MRAVYYEEFGLVDKIKVGTLPVPELQEGEVLVQVKAAAINPFDAGNLQAKEVVLILGASGGVGSLGIRLANAKGVRVIGVASRKITNICGS